MLSAPARLTTLGTHLVMAVVGLAGLMKLLDLGEFDRSLATWVLLPPWVRMVAAPSVPFVEVFIAASWFLAPGRRWVVHGALGLLALFALVYALHTLTVGPPDCNCFGPLARYQAMRETAGRVLARDVVMCGALAAYLWVRRGGRT